MTVDILRNNDLYLQELQSPLGGNYQKKNILTVCAACERLLPRIAGISTEEIRNGILHVIENTSFAGRWQILSESPLTICDTGHNEAGLKEVLAQIKTIRHETLHFVFGLVNDKEIRNILQLLPKSAIYYFCKADIPRGLDASELRINAKEFGLEGLVYGSVKEALQAARLKANANDLVFVGGSTFIVAEVV
jgi:dihydrofolate synthase/folylpolyglutamate synthase